MVVAFAAGMAWLPPDLDQRIWHAVSASASAARPRRHSPDRAGAAGLDRLPHLVARLVLGSPARHHRSRYIPPSSRRNQEIDIGFDTAAGRAPAGAGAGRGQTPAFTKSDPALPPGTTPYEPHIAKRPTGSLSIWVAQLVEAEGPLHEEELLQALRDDHGYGRLGTNIRWEFDHAIREAERRDAIVRRDAWLWPAAVDVAEAPVRVRVGEPRRRFEWYSNEELLRALRIACSVSGALSREGLVEATGRLLAGC